jgi:hypothetical protein
MSVSFSPQTASSGVLVTSGSEYRPLRDGETTIGFSIVSSLSRTRSQLRGDPNAGDD